MAEFRRDGSNSVPASGSKAVCAFSERQPSANVKNELLQNIPQKVVPQTLHSEICRLSLIHI